MVLFSAFAQDEDVDALVEREGLPGVADALVVELEVAEAATLDEAAGVTFDRNYLISERSPDTSGCHLIP